MDLSVELCGLRLEHPVLNGSGTFDAIAARRAFGEELLDEFPFSAFVSKTITPEPRVGNPPPRIFETPSGMINSIGLPNKGLHGFLEQDLPLLAQLPVPLVVSVMGTSHEEFARLVEGVASRAEVAALELNVSCPNVESGLIIGQQPEETLALTQGLRPRTPKPLIVKLTPNVTEPAVVARAAEEGGADAVSLVNTLEAAAIDPGDPEAVASGRPRGPLGPRDTGLRRRPGARGRGRGLGPGDRHGRDRVGGRRARFPGCRRDRRGRWHGEFSRPAGREQGASGARGRPRRDPGRLDLGPAGPDHGVDLNLRSNRISAYWP